MRILGKKKIFDGETYRCALYKETGKSITCRKLCIDDNKTAPRCIYNIHLDMLGLKTY